jgi:hypothetical protein
MLLPMPSPMRFKSSPNRRPRRGSLKADSSISPWVQCFNGLDFRGSPLVFGLIEILDLAVFEPMEHLAAAIRVLDKES